jgi:hypothetical protein
MSVDPFPVPGACGSADSSEGTFLKSAGINPEEYLNDVLARLPSMKINQIHELLPGQWKPLPADTS